MSQWFSTARFGMFVHWGHSSQQGLELSWPLVGGVFSLPFCSNIPVAQYHATAPQFNPQHYDPAAWAQLAKQVGMQYVVLTAKHHDGFALTQRGLSSTHPRYRWCIKCQACPYKGLELYIWRR